MKHHFTLTFRVNARQSVDVGQVARQMSGSDFHIESAPFNGTEFSVHFEREGSNAMELLEYARDQVITAVPGADLIEMDMTEEPPMMGAVDDITKLVVHACRVFGDPELAHTWLSQPQNETGGNVPKVLMIDAEGRTLISRVLTRLEKQS